jgi:hypothetical protein
MPERGFRAYTNSFKYNVSVDSFGYVERKK